jgi:hypothetical protein
MWKQGPIAIERGLPIPKKEFIFNFFFKPKNHQKPKSLVVKENLSSASFIELIPVFHLKNVLGRLNEDMF